MKKECVCVECEHCRLEIEKAKAKAERSCAKTGEKLKEGEVIHRCACKKFKPQPATGHWGP